MAWPMPRLAPETSALRPERSNSLLWSDILKKP